MNTRHYHYNCVFSYTHILTASVTLQNYRKNDSEDNEILQYAKYPIHRIYRTKIGPKHNVIDSNLAIKPT